MSKKTHILNVKLIIEKKKLFDYHLKNNNIILNYNYDFKNLKLEEIHYKTFRILKEYFYDQSCFDDYTFDELKNLFLKEKNFKINLSKKHKSIFFKKNSFEKFIRLFMKKGKKKKAIKILTFSLYKFFQFFNLRDFTYINTFQDPNIFLKKIFRDFQMYNFSFFFNWIINFNKFIFFMKILKTPKFIKKKTKKMYMLKPFKILKTIRSDHTLRYFFLFSKTEFFSKPLEYCLINSFFDTALNYKKSKFSAFRNKTTFKVVKLLREK